MKASDNPEITRLSITPDSIPELMRAIDAHTKAAVLASQQPRQLTDSECDALSDEIVVYRMFGTVNEDVFRREATRADIRQWFAGLK